MISFGENSISAYDIKAVVESGKEPDTLTYLVDQNGNVWYELSGYLDVNYYDQNNRVCNIKIPLNELKETGAFNNGTLMVYNTNNPSKFYLMEPFDTILRSNINNLISISEYFPGTKGSGNPNYISAIAKETFSGANNLSSIQITKCETTKEGIFKNCTSLENVEMRSVDKMAGSAYTTVNGCSKLTSYLIDKSDTYQSIDNGSGYNNSVVISKKDKRLMFALPFLNTISSDDILGVPIWTLNINPNLSSIYLKNCTEFNGVQLPGTLTHPIQTLYINNNTLRSFKDDVGNYKGVMKWYNKNGVKGFYDLQYLCPTFNQLSVLQKSSDARFISLSNDDIRAYHMTYDYYIKDSISSIFINNEVFCSPEDSNGKYLTSPDKKQLKMIVKGKRGEIDFCAQNIQDIVNLCAFERIGDSVCSKIDNLSCISNDNVASIGSASFSTCKNLTAVYFKNLTSFMGDSGNKDSADQIFYGSNKLQVVCLPKLSVGGFRTTFINYIGNEIPDLSAYTPLSVWFPNVPTIGNSMFKYHRGLYGRLYLPKVKEIGAEAFSYCTLMERDRTKDGVPYNSYIDFGNEMSSVPAVLSSNAFDWINDETAKDTEERSPIRCVIPDSLSSEWEEDTTWYVLLKKNKVELCCYSQFYK